MSVDSSRGSSSPYRRVDSCSCAHSAAGENSNAPPPRRPLDAIAEAQTPKEAPAERPEQKKTAHDLSDIFTPSKALPSSEALADQPEHGGMTGFDFYRDPLGAMKPGTTFEEIYKAAVADKPTVMATAAEAAGEPLRPRAQARPGGQDVARQAPRGRADRPAAAREWTGRRWPP